MRLFRPGFIAGWLYPEALFRVKTTEKILFLTFDDGPDPYSTPQLLDKLKEHNVHALFFCNGRAAERYPDLMNQIRQGGHLIGNHGYNHFDGWRTDPVEWIKDVIRASAFTSDRIFRPPFGRLSNRERRLLKTYKLVFWDIMAYDFDASFGDEKTLKILKEKIRPGAIIVLHDTSSSSANKIIGEFLTYAVNSSYRFELLDSEQRP